MKYLTLIILALFLAVPGLRAALIVEDFFATNLSGGTGLDGSWSGSDQSFTASGLTYSDAVSGNSLGSAGAVTASEDRTAMERSLTTGASASTAETAGGNEIWIAWLGSGSSDVSMQYSIFFEPGATSTSTESSLILSGAFGGGIDIQQREELPAPDGRTNTSFAQDVGNTSTDGSANLFVGQFNFQIGANDTFRLWVNPTLEPTGPGDTGLSDYGDSGVQNLTADLESILGFNNRPQNGDRNDYSYTFDEFRIGTSYAQVIAIPEPTTFSLLALLFGCALMGHRRRRSQA